MKKLEIKLFNNNGEVVSVAGFSPNKVKHITKTKQWDQVMEVMTKNSDK